nr:reverse transcriptase domain-containing protein [Tanacetum cinerariifolium]
MTGSDKKIAITPLPKLPSPSSPLISQNSFIPISPYSSPYSPRPRPTYSALANTPSMSQTSTPYTRSPSTASSSSNITRSPSDKAEFQINPNKQIIKILEPLEEKKLNQGFVSLIEYLYPRCWELNVRSIPTSSAVFPLLVMCSHFQKKFPLLEESSHCQKKFPLCVNHLERSCLLVFNRPNPQALIPYPSRRNDERNRERAKDQIEKFYQIFKDMSFVISFADALMLMPKFASTLKALIGNKEKLSEMARTPLNEHCSAVLLKKLPKN